MKTNKISVLSRVLCLAGAVCLTVSLFVPLWRIELDAPQYPEGLALLIYPGKLGGNVDIINGLNHYIGMQTLHAENFIEFTVLPYIIGFFSVLVLLAAMVGRRRFLYGAFGVFVLFGIVAMVDFWRWEYNYGHNLDPNAAIIVPGMAYQPPLIGFKQLLNFGAYSIPDLGGWLFIVCGLLLLVSVLKEAGVFARFRKKGSVVLLSFFTVGLMSSCSTGQPEAIKLHSDKCDFCKMTIADNRFAAELITEKGRVYKFDDLSCMLEYAAANPLPAPRLFWVANFAKPGEWLNARQAYYVKADELRSPMRGNIVAFAQQSDAADAAKKLNGTIIGWKSIAGR